MGRFFKNSSPQMTMDFLYTPPWEQIQKAMQINEKGISDTINQGLGIEANLIDTATNANDQKYLNTYFDGIKKRIKDIENNIFKGNDVTSWGAQQIELSKLKMELVKEMKAGNWAKIKSFDKQYAQHMKSITDNKTLDANYKTLLKNHFAEKNKEGAIALGKYNGADIADAVDFNKMLSDIVKELIPESYGRIKQSADGKGYLYWDEHKNKWLSADRIMYDLQDRILSDPNSLAYMKQATLIKAGHYFNDKGEFDLYITKKIKDEKGKEHEIKVLNPIHSLSRVFDRANTHAYKQTEDANKISTDNTALYNRKEAKEKEQDWSKRRLDTAQKLSKALQEGDKPIVVNALLKELNELDNARGISQHKLSMEEDNILFPSTGGLTKNITDKIRNKYLKEVPKEWLKYVQPALEHSTTLKELENNIALNYMKDHPEFKQLVRDGSLNKKISSHGQHYGTIVNTDINMPNSVREIRDKIEILGQTYKKINNDQIKIYNKTTPNREVYNVPLELMSDVRNTLRHMKEHLQFIKDGKPISNKDIDINKLSIMNIGITNGIGSSEFFTGYNEKGEYIEFSLKGKNSEYAKILSHLGRQASERAKPNSRNGKTHSTEYYNNPRYKELYEKINDNDEVGNPISQAVLENTERKRKVKVVRERSKIKEGEVIFHMYLGDVDKPQINVNDMTELSDTLLKYLDNK